MDVAADLLDAYTPAAYNSSRRKLKPSLHTRSTGPRRGGEVQKGSRSPPRPEGRKKRLIGSLFPQRMRS
jgi:hypothetical protein